ncbi:hypothetical protein BN137_355 [Cronobacter condimenti 1330]|uniref:Uncharacterized protein n=1 Tax=Cronobacter condimenti 1330 TaxID=1073999 RepID=K7ZYC7_9ENTR|nr:hypothetical protein BN137_355 [Cronobacter condimenti 1330]
MSGVFLCLFKGTSSQPIKKAPLEGGAFSQAGAANGGAALLLIHEKSVQT